MAKQLPKIFQSPISHKIENNNKMFYSLNQEKAAQNAPIISQNNKNIESVEKTLDNLFHTTGYIFNIPVEIVTKEKKLQTKIAGKVKNTIITLDNDVIPITEIISIKRKDRF